MRSMGERLEEIEAFKAQKSQEAFCDELSRLCGQGAGLGANEAKAFVEANWEWASCPLTMTSETALHVAAKAGSAAMARALIEAGADVEALTIADETPLMGACEAGPGALGALRELIGAGASVSGESLVCKGAIDRVARRAERRPVGESVQMLSELIKAGAPVDKGWAELTSILSNKGDQGLKEELVKGLLAAGVAVDLKDERGETALLRACAWCDNAAETGPVAFLLSLGANPNATSSKGASMLRLCAQSSRLGPRPAACDELVARLLEAGADPFFKEPDGVSVAQLARDEDSRLSKNAGSRALILAWVERSELEAAGSRAPEGLKKRGLSL